MQKQMTRAWLSQKKRPSGRNPGGVSNLWRARLNSRLSHHLPSSPPPQERLKTTAPTGMHTIASLQAKLSFFFSFSFSFGLLMSNDFQVFCSWAMPVSPWTWPPCHQAMPRHDVASPTANDRSPVMTILTLMMTVDTWCIGLVMDG